LSGNRPTGRGNKNSFKKGGGNKWGKARNYQFNGSKGRGYESQKGTVLDVARGHHGGTKDVKKRKFRHFNNEKGHLKMGERRREQKGEKVLTVDCLNRHQLARGAQRRGKSISNVVLERYRGELKRKWCQGGRKKKVTEK